MLETASSSSSRRSTRRTGDVAKPPPDVGIRVRAGLTDRQLHGHSRSMSLAVQRMLGGVLRPASAASALSSILSVAWRTTSASTTPRAMMVTGTTRSRRRRDEPESRAGHHRRDLEALGGGA